MAKKNFHVFLSSRPGEDNEPTEENFGFEEITFPEDPPKNGEILIQNKYLSLDPALRCRMNSDSGAEYIKSWQIAETLTGFGGVGVVISSGDPNFCAGDWVTGSWEWPWSMYFTIPSLSVKKVPQEILDISPTLCLSAFGLTGLTAFLGVTEKAHVIAGTNQTMVISGAAGSTGSLAGQIAKAEGYDKVIGICGSDTKCTCLIEELGFDAAINYKKVSVTGRLAEICQQGIDTYFDNVGGSISDEVIKLMNPGSHVVLCGQIAVYNKNLPYPPPIPDETAAILKERGITRERFLVLNYQEKFESSVEKLMELYATRRIKVKETIEQGLIHAGRAFVSMMKGGNLGKQLVEVTEG